MKKAAMTRGYSKRAKRHAAESKMRSERMVKGAKRQRNPVKVSWLPGFEPPEPPPLGSYSFPKTKFPFPAKINGREAIVHERRIEYP